MHRIAYFGWHCSLAVVPLILSACVSITPIRDDCGLGLACPGPAIGDFARIAGQIDRLEKEIDKHGSVVPKHADIWGQARLTMHRQEFEREMKKDLCTFDVNNIQAAISTSDQALLAESLALQNAAAGKAGLPDVSALVSDNTTTIARNTLTPNSAFSLSKGKLSIEPTLIEDQKRRFLDHLHELRRVNEGDDSADAPGYTLNLMSIPISVLTGDCTQAGYGAECTITANPRLTDDLLPMTFRDLVINDLLELLTLNITKTVEQLFKDKAVAEEARSLLPLLFKLERQVAGAEYEAAKKTIVQIEQTDVETRSLLVDFAMPTPGTSIRPGKQRPIPASQVLTFIGRSRILAVAVAVYDQLQMNRRACNNHILYLDVRSILRQEFLASYNYLSTNQRGALWSVCGPDLVEAIRTVDRPAVLRIFHDFNRLVLPPPENERPPLVEIMAWPILLDSALLNAEFVKDMQQTRSIKGYPCVRNEWPTLYLPSPPPEARKLFNEYVQCRWPLRVFALDPETEDQNIADSFRLRREMQFALSLAFANGQIGARSFTRYTRRIEQDIDTIAINRTQIGFSHGDNTFGWRFYPRVQTPPIEGNAQAIFRDLLIGGRQPGYDLRRRRLENGIRHCVALVIMPSFVPSVDLEVTGNWFHLAHPKCKDLTMAQTLRLSEEVQTLQTRCAQGCDSGRYRPGDTALVSSRIEQLSQRLPLQHQTVNVPYENTHGGFELLSTGVTNLGPELLGWYGAPGVNPNGDTSIFLVGNNFSVHQTRVVAGGLALDQSCTVQCQASTPAASASCKGPASPTPAATAAATPTAPTDKASACGTTVGQIYQVELLSRQVMRVIIPKGVYHKDGFVDIHIATPYGVSPSVQVPVLGTATPAAKAPAEGYSVSEKSSQFTIPYKFAVQPALPSGFEAVMNPAPKGAISINWNDASGEVLKTVKANVTFEVGPEKVKITIPVTLEGKDGSFTLSGSGGGEPLNVFSQELLDGINGLFLYSPEKPLPAFLESTEIEILPVSPLHPKGPTPDTTHDVKTVKVSGKITVQFQQFVLTPAADK